MAEEAMTRTQWMVGIICIAFMVLTWVAMAELLQVIIGPCFTLNRTSFSESNDWTHRACKELPTANRFFSAISYSLSIRWGCRFIISLVTVVERQAQATLL